MEKYQCMTHGFNFRDDCTDCHYCMTSNIRTDGVSTMSVKHDAGKPDMTLITYGMITDAVKVLEHGAKVYGRLNYRKSGPEFDERLVAAVLRHMTKYTGGQELDDESGLPHLAHALASLMLIFDRRNERANSK